MQEDQRNVNSIYVPDRDLNFVPFGNYEDIKTIIRSERFFPVWIHGLSGNGKTHMVKQACAPEFDEVDNMTYAGREFIRFNFTVETDENDLFGRHQLVETQSGATVTQWVDGPITIAMRRGAVVLLDELDVGHTNRIMALQSVLEGEGVLLKATGEYVKPAKGFQIIATGNTKGRGCEDGKFIGTQILNEAMRNRFAAFIEQDYPEMSVEIDILSNYFVDYCFESKGIPVNDIPAEEATAGNVFINKLCEWSAQIRATKKAGGDTQEDVTTRCLINIIKGYSITGNTYKSVVWACENFPNETRDKFVQIWEKMNEVSNIGGEQTPEGEKYKDFKKQVI